MINYVIQDNVCIIKFANGKANLIDEQFINTLINMLRKIKEERNLGIVLTSDGNMFSAGINIKYLIGIETNAERSALFCRLDELLYELFCFPNPVVSAINGHSIGAGLLIQMCSDYCYISNNPKIKYGLPEISIGLAINAMMYEILLYTMKSNKSISRILYSGRLFGSEEALYHGIADEIADSCELVRLAKEKVLSLSGVNPESFSTLKRVIKRRTLRNMKKCLKRDINNDIAELLGNEETQRLLANI